MANLAGTLISSIIVWIGTWVMYFLSKDMVPDAGIGAFSQDQIRQYIYLFAVCVTFFYPLFVCGAFWLVRVFKPDC